MALREKNECTTPSVRRSGSSLLVAGILLTAAAIWLVGLRGNLRVTIQVDEERYVSPGVAFVLTGNWNGGRYNHPGATSKLMTGLAFVVYDAIEDSFDRATIQEAFLRDPTPFYYIGRLVAACFGLCAVYITYRLGKHLFSTFVGLTGALLLAVAPLFNAWVRVARDDSAVTLLVTLSVYFAFLAYARATAWRYALAGAAVGLSIATKYTSASVVLVLLVLHYIKAWNTQSSFVQSHYRWVATASVVIIAGVLATFVAGIPPKVIRLAAVSSEAAANLVGKLLMISVAAGVILATMGLMTSLLARGTRRGWLTPSVVAWEAVTDYRLLLAGIASLVVFLAFVPETLSEYRTIFWQVMQEFRRDHVGHNPLPGIQNVVWYFTVPMLGGFGKFGGLLALPGLALTLRKRRLTVCALILFMLAFIMSITQSLRHRRWALPMFPFLGLFAGVTVQEIHLWVRQKHRVLACVVFGTLLATTVLSSLTVTLKSNLLAMQTDTHTVATKWATENIPVGATIAYESYTATLSPGPHQSKATRVWTLHQLGDAQDVLTDYDYVIASSRWYKGYQEEADLYPLESAFYRTLMAEGRLVAAFESRHDRSMMGWGYVGVLEDGEGMRPDFDVRVYTRGVEPLTPLAF